MSSHISSLARSWPRSIRRSANRRQRGFRRFSAADKLKSSLALAGAVLAGRTLVDLLTRRDLNGQVALITGGSRGLGLLLAREFGRAGCRVAICARDPQELEEARKHLRAWGMRKVFTYPCDITDEVQVKLMLAGVEASLGRIDILVNNAGIIQSGPLQSLMLDDFQQAMDVMFWGAVYTTMALLPTMLDRNSGHIVNITSIAGKVALPHLLPYDTAKFAAVAFSEGLAAELTGTQVRVTTVVPGLMRTGSYLNAFFKGSHEEEFRWFGISDNLPLLSIDAERAAARIVRAVRRGDPEVILTLPASVLVRLHGLFPQLMIRLLGWGGRLLLPEGSNPARVRGMIIEENIESPLFHWLTGWGRSAARRFNQYSGVTTPQEQ